MDDNDRARFRLLLLCSWSSLLIAFLILAALMAFWTRTRILADPAERIIFWNILLTACVGGITAGVIGLRQARRFSASFVVIPAVCGVLFNFSFVGYLVIRLVQDIFSV